VTTAAALALLSEKSRYPKSGADHKYGYFTLPDIFTVGWG
jgi:hypothetical protein